MLSFNTLLTLAIAFTSSVNALAVRDTKPGVVSFGLSSKKTTKPVAPKSKGPVHGTSQLNAIGFPEPKLFATGESYLINLGVGEADQQVEVNFDTGSSDLWVDQRVLSDTSVFNSNGQYFGIGYGDGTTARGTYGTSSLFFEDGQEVSEVQWALVTNVHNTTGPLNGILGVGKLTNEASKFPYSNFPEQLKQNGLIDTNGYSYYLGREGGKIIFGGKDLDKIKGDLVDVPKGDDNVGVFDNGQVQSVSFGNITFEGFDAFFDSGSTLSYIPNEIIKGLNIPGVTSIDDGYGPFYYYTASPPDGAITVTINGLDIEIPLKDLSVVEVDDNFKPTGRYYFGLQDSGSVYGQLGDTFLQHVYIVVNHDDDTVQIGNVQITDSENVVPL